MAAPEATLTRIGRLLGLFVKNFTLNSYRRLLIWGQKSLLWRRRRLLAAGYRRFGQEVFRQLQAGDFNPLLQEGIKDQIDQLKLMEEQVAAREQRVVELRDQIKATSYRLPAPPAGPPASEDQPAPEP